MRINAKVTKYIGLYLFTLPFVFLFGYGMLINTEAFFPFFVSGLTFLVLGVLGLKHLYEMFTQTTEYIFEIDGEMLGIQKLVNDKVTEDHTIKKQNIQTFTNRYRDNYGAVTAIYEFTLKDGSIIVIKEDFGSDEAKIMEELIRFGYIPQSMIEQFKKEGMCKDE